MEQVSGFETPPPHSAVPFHLAGGRTRDAEKNTWESVAGAI